MKIMFLLFLIIMTLIVLSSCRAASKCSREEELRDIQKHYDLH